MLEAYQHVQISALGINHRQIVHLNYAKDNVLKIFQIIHGLDKCDMLFFILVVFNEPLLYYFIIYYIYISSPLTSPRYSSLISNIQIYDFIFISLKEKAIAVLEMQYMKW